MKRRTQILVAALGMSGAALCAALVSTTVVVGATGCVDHSCEGDIILYGGAPGQGGMVDPNTWQSTPNQGPWLDYPAQRIWIFNPIEMSATYPDGGPHKQRVLRSAQVYVSPASDPNHVPGAGEFGDNYAPASGNTAELTYNTSGFFLHNDTCAHYYVRTVVTFEPEDAGDAGSDAPSEGGGAGDAGSDAPTD